MPAMVTAAANATDVVRAAIIATIQSFFPVAIIIGLFELSDVEISVVMLFVTNMLTLIFLLIPKNQPPVDPTPQPEFPPNA